MSEIFSGFEKQAVIKEVTQVHICISKQFLYLLFTTKVTVPKFIEIGTLPMHLKSIDIGKIGQP